MSTTPRPGTVRRLKRVLIGRPLPTERLVHERLGKPTALAVFSSDALSSTAYGTEEILRVLVPAVGAAAFALVVPITLAVLGVLAVLLFSYRQTIKAYPSTGGAYLVTKDNFGLLPAQVAGISLLVDYVLTASVSSAAGTAALTSAAPALFRWRVAISVGFIALIALGNLRGVRESGRIFAVPTYFFLAMMFTLLGTAAVRMLTGSVAAVSTYPLPPPNRLQPLTVFPVLRAFASGGAALTGVEAISNGVTAFRPPEWRNARTTLMWMGSLLGVMFCGLSVLASRLQVVPDPHEKVTVVAQIARAVFGDSAGGHAAFLCLQVATLLVLVMAANTSFADFPRLASFHAADRFLPVQLTQYGDRLVFSNGIIALAILASGLIVIFDASVTRLIPLYAIGVFTSFTFSQAGMALRHWRHKEPRWRRGLAINGLGAVVTGVVAVIIAATKFMSGAWIVLVAIPLILLVLGKINRHYREVGRILRDPARRPPPQLSAQRVLIAVDRPGPDDQLAAAYAARIAPAEIRVVHIGSSSEELLEAWSRFAVSDTLQVIPPRSTVAADLLAYVREVRREMERPNEILNVVIPEEVIGGGSSLYLLRRAKAQFIKAALMAEPDIVITNVTAYRGSAPPDPLEAVRWRHVVIVLVSAVHNATLRALAYARSLAADEVHCVHVAVDPMTSERVVRDWDAWGPEASLEVIPSPYRHVAPPVLARVRSILAANPQTFVTVVLPEFVLTRLWHQALHNQTALLLKRALLFEPSVMAVTAVPYRLNMGRAGPPRAPHAR